MSALRRVGLNLLYLVPGETGGMETYAVRLVPELAAARPDLELVAFVNREALDARGERAFGPRVRIVPVRVSGRSRVQRAGAEQLLLPRLLRRHGIQLLHSLGGTAPRRPGMASVLTLHDLIYARHPEAHTKLMALGMRALVPLAARSADRIIAVSEATKAEIGRVLDIPSDRVDVVYEGGRPLGPATPESELRARLRLDDAAPLVLSVSARRPHKNLSRLLQAFAGLAEGPLLVLPGYPTPFEGELAAEVARLGLGRRVRLLGWVSEEDLEALYLAARCFVFPSLAEGFGLPVLEAMERGLPVACSDASSLPEIAGDAVRYFDPRDVTQMRRAIAELLEDGAMRARLAAAGRDRARLFSWERAAAETVAVYEHAWETSRRSDRAAA
jgi:glycosyltransferase involved in cell wall biosynthesis